MDFFRLSAFIATLPIKQFGVLILMAFASLMPSKAHSQQDESPLQCSLQGVAVKCDVVADQIDIQDVVLNRARCDSPVPTEEDKHQSTQFIDNLPEDVKGSLDFVIPQFFILASMTKCQRDMPNFSASDCKAFLSMIKVMNNPVGDHSFGDKISFSTVGCANLLEYTIVIDGSEWTWKTR